MGYIVHLPRRESVGCSKYCEEIMGPKVIPDVTKNYNPEICLHPVSVLQVSPTVCLSNNYEGYQEQRDRRNQSQDQIFQLRKALVELVGDDDAEAESEPEGGVYEEEGLPPPLARIRGQPRTGAAAPPPGCFRGDAVSAVAAASFIAIGIFSVVGFELDSGSADRPHFRRRRRRRKKRV